MVLLIQRVERAELIINSERMGSIDTGYLTYIGFEAEDVEVDCKWIANKICSLRIMDDGEGRMNTSLIGTPQMNEQDNTCYEKGDSSREDVGVMLIPNFTLPGNAIKGNRPSFGNSMSYDKAEMVFAEVSEAVRTKCDDLGIHFVKGIFGANMKIESVASGPVNLVLNRIFD